MADERIDIDVSAALRDIAQLSSGLDGLQKKAKAAGTAFDDAFNADEAQGVADALQDLQKQYDSLKRSADVLKAANRNATNPDAIRLYTAQIAKLEAGMKRLELAGKQAGVNLQKVNKEANTGKEVFENFFGTFTKATIIIAAIEAVRKFASQALDLASQTSKAARQFEAFTGSADKAKGIVADLTGFANAKILDQQEVFQAGKALLAFGESSENLVPVLGRIADLSRATGKDFGELTTIYGKARTAGVLYAEDINQLVDAGIPIIQEFAKQMGVSADQVKKLASEGKISFEELQLAFFNLTAEGGKFAGQAEAGIEAGDRFNAAWTEALTKVGVKLKPAWDFILNSLTGILDSVSKLADSKGFISFAENTFRAMAKITPGFALLEKLTDKLRGKEEEKGAFFALPNAEEAKQQNELRLKLEKEAEEKRKKLAAESAKEAAKRAKQRAKELEQQEKELQRLRFDAMKDGEEKEIALENFRFAELKKQLDKYHLDTSQAEEQHQKNLAQIVAKYAIQRFTAEQELIELRKAQAEFETQQAAEGVERERKRAEGVQKVRESEIDVLEAQFDNFIKAMEANGSKQKDIAKRQLDFDTLIKQYRLENELKYQEALLSTIDKGDKDAIEQAKNRILLLKSQLEGLTINVPSPKGDGSTFLEGLGFNDDQISALRAGADDVISIIQDVTDIAIQKAEEQIRASEKQTAAAQAYYDEQKKLSEEGYANDLDLAERRLQAAKQQEERALAQKKKAQREQLLIESALQAANIATAAANTFKTFNGPLLPVGIALVAAMIGAFVASKARALQATKFRDGGEGYVDGRGVIVGNSHERGGVKFEAEGGEFMGTDGKRFGIVNKRMTAKHFDLLQAINRDDRQQMARALSSLAAPIDRESIASAAGSSVAILAGGKDKDTYNLLKDWRKDNKQQVSVTAAGGYLIERRGHVTIKTKIK